MSGEKKRIIYEGDVNSEHILRIICEKIKNEISVITFYPARRGRYENKL